MAGVDESLVRKTRRIAKISAVIAAIALTVGAATAIWGFAHDNQISATFGIIAVIASIFSLSLSLNVLSGDKK